ncbi:MAG: ABC transporter ATP-binding protein [Lachnospiraceae bacterium]|nr:ABC transporter ATP-binding protein [Lachnospiraceae bacterium]
MEKINVKKYSLPQNIIYVYRGVAKHKPYLIALLVLSLFCGAGSKFIWLFLSKYIIEYISTGMREADLIRIVLILSVSNIICMLGQNAVDFGKEPAAFYVRPMFMLKRNRKTIDMFYENLEDRKVLDAVERSKAATRNVDVGIEGIIRFTLDLCRGAFTCIVAAMIMLRLSVPMVLLVMVFCFIAYLSADKAARLEKKLTDDDVTYEKRKLEHFKKISKDFRNGKDIRIYGVAKKLYETQSKLHELLHERLCRARFNWMRSGLLSSVLELVREGILYYILISFILDKHIGIADLMLYLGCVHNLAESFDGFLKTFAKMRKCSAQVNDYRALNEFCDEQNKADDEKTCIDQDELLSAKGYKFYFDKVSFKYPGSETYALKDLSLTFNAGEKLAIVGLNGAGKTTFVKLLLKLYHPCSGKIYINGVDIAEIPDKQYYRLFAPVFQDMECYAFSLTENISMKKEEATDKERARKCIEQAGLGNKLAGYKEGVDTPMLRVLHDDGMVLSGGELQKMALARALYKDAPVVVLDEPTAALDAMAESRMYEQFDAMVDGKSAVYISHRLSSTRFCDRIALFENGCIKEYGSHEELIKRGGAYARMYEMQSHYYKEGEEDEAAV